jgi:hypothetical protein
MAIGPYAPKIRGGRPVRGLFNDSLLPEILGMGELNGWDSIRGDDFLSIDGASSAVRSIDLSRPERRLRQSTCQNCEME